MKSSHEKRKASFRIRIEKDGEVVLDECATTVLAVVNSDENCTSFIQFKRHGLVELIQALTVLRKVEGKALMAYPEEVRKGLLKAVDFATALGLGDINQEEDETDKADKTDEADEPDCEIPCFKLEDR